MGLSKKTVRLTEKRAVVQELTQARVKPERACFLVGLSRSSWYYQAKQRQDTDLRVRLRTLAQQHPRRGYRFIHALLKQEGLQVNRKRIQRLWRAEGLSVPRKKQEKVRTEQEFLEERCLQITFGPTISSSTRPSRARC